MTGANTDAVSTPLHEITASALRQLATQFFNPQARTVGDLFVWTQLRSIADKLSLRRAMELTQQEICELRGLLELCEPGLALEFVLAQTFMERG